MKIRCEKGYTGIDIAVSVVIMFIFISVVAMLVYQVNSTSRQIELKGNAIYFATNEIEIVKIDGFEEYVGRSVENGNSKVVENEEFIEGFYKTITVEDYKDIQTDAIADVVKKVTVKISYMFQGDEQSVELSTILSKEN